MKNILVTGAYGQLGNEVRILSANYPEYNFMFTDVDSLDICDKDELIDILSTYPGDIVVYFKIDGKNYRMSQTVRNCRGLINELLSIVDDDAIKFFKA